MKVGVMITNGGTHPPEKWAEQSADQIIDAIQLEPTYVAYEAALQGKNLLRDKVRDALVGLHGQVQSKERGYLQASSGHLAEPLDPSDHIDEALAAVNAAIAGSMFASHYAKPDTQLYIKNVLASHFSSSMHIERSWHADKNPDDANAKAFRAQHHPGA